MAVRYLDDEIAHLLDNFLQEDTNEYLENILKEAPHDGYDDYDNGSLDSIDELIFLCEETFECRVEKTSCKVFRQATNESQSGIQDDHLLIYSFGETQNITLESPIQDIDEKTVSYSMSSGDILYLPSTDNPRIYTASKSKSKKPGVMLFFHITKPYSGSSEPDNVSMAMMNFNGGMFGQGNMFGSNGSMPPGVVSFSRHGNTTDQIIDADSDYGRAIMRQVSASLAAQGINFDWDD